jgi:hypothetical protein
VRGELGILTSGAEGDPSSSFSILPISPAVGHIAASCDNGGFVWQRIL